MNFDAKYTMIFTPKRLVMALSALCFCSAYAQEVYKPTPANPTAVLPESPRPMGADKGASVQQSIAVSDEQLASDPALLASILDKAVEGQAWGVVAHLLPMYAQVQARDETLLRYAQARLAHAQGDYPRAIATYRQILNASAELTPVRMYLAQALFENQENEAATFQLEKVQADNPPEPVLKMVAQYLSAIRQRSGWRVNGYVNYVSDDNVNNASSDRMISINGQPTRLQLSEASLPKSGQGLSYGANVARDFYISDQHAVTTSVNLNGKSYWNRHDYDDIFARVNVGYQWQSARKVFALVPFYQKRWFAGKNYSDTYGVRLNSSYLIAPNWQVGGAYEYGQNRYDERGFLDGAYHFVSLSSNYTLNAKTQVFAGVDVTDDQTQDASDSSLRVGYRVGMVRELPLNLSAQVQLGVANKLFDAVSFFGVRRDEREYNGTLTLWNRGWYWYGVMPKLNFEYTRTRSNISMYSFQKNRIYLSLDRRF